MEAEPSRETASAMETPPEIGASGHRVGRRGPDPLAPLEDDPFGGATLEELDALGAGSAGAPELTGDELEPPGEPPPEMACAPLGDEIRVWPRAAYADLVAVGDDFAVAGYAATRDDEGEPAEEVFVVAVSPGSAPRPVFRENLERPLVNTRLSVPGLGTIGDDAVALAVTDRASKVRFRRISLGDRTLGGWQELGARVDARYPPLVTSGDSESLLVTWTEGDETGMKLNYARFDGTGAKLEDGEILPAAMGAAAPVQIHGGRGISYLDAHVATSNVLFSRLDGELNPGTPEVLRPISNLFDPPCAAVAQVDGGRFLVAYTAVGDLARTAVGIVTLEADGAMSIPQPLVASAGYGLLHVDAAAKPRGARRAVFVGDASRGVDSNSPREVRVRVVAGQERGLRMGEALTLRGPDGSARFGRVARRRDGVYAVSYRSGSGTHLQFLRCDE